MFLSRDAYKLSGEPVVPSTGTEEACERNGGCPSVPGDMPTGEGESQRRRRIGERIAHARKVAGLEQQDLADELGISDRALRYIERGERSPDRYLDDIARLTGRSVEWFVTGVDAPRDEAIAELRRRIDDQAEELRRQREEHAVELEKFRDLLRQHGLLKNGNGVRDKA